MAKGDEGKSELDRIEVEKWEECETRKNNIKLECGERNIKRNLKQTQKGRSHYNVYKISVEKKKKLEECVMEN